MVATDASVSAIGAAFYGTKGMIGLSFGGRVFANGLLNFAMPQMAHGLKLSTQIEGRRRWLFWAMVLAILAGTGGAMWAFLDLTYKYGAINLSSRGFFWYPNYVFDYALRVSDQSDPNWLGWFHTSIGAIIMVLLLVARRFFAWWPLHPLGYPISSTLEWVALNAFLAWAIKGPILRFGGVRLYRQVRPFFLGLILGHFVTHGVWWFIDLYNGVSGNYLWP